MKKAKLKRNLSLKSRKKALLNLSRSRAMGPNGPSFLTQLGGGGLGLAVLGPDGEAFGSGCVSTAPDSTACRARMRSRTHSACLESCGRSGREYSHSSRAWG